MKTSASVAYIWTARIPKMSDTAVLWETAQPVSHEADRSMTWFGILTKPFPFSLSNLCNMAPSILLSQILAICAVAAAGMGSTPIIVWSSCSHICHKHLKVDALAPLYPKHACLNGCCEFASCCMADPCSVYSTCQTILASSQITWTPGWTPLSPGKNVLRTCLGG